MLAAKPFRGILIAAIVFGMFIPRLSVGAEPDGLPKETKQQRDQRMAWWRNARFGMFIHWGLYAVPAGTWNGKRIDGIGEWIMNSGKIPVADYEKLTAKFNPVKFDADAWVKVAKDAGMKYIVITSKHHDGFAMFHSKASPYNIYNATPFHRDPLAELAAACKKQGIRLGFYYSQAQDWHHPGGAAWGGHWDKAQDGDMTEYLRKIAVPQVREILSNYGPVAVLWWDTPCDMTKERADMLLSALEAATGHHHQRPARRRLRRRHQYARAVHPGHRFPRRPRLGNLHDHERHLGLQIVRPELEIDRNAAAQLDRHRQQGRQLLAERRPHVRRLDAPGRASNASRRSESG